MTGPGLVAFLNARLAEDEDIARYCQQASLSAAIKTMSGDDRFKLFLARHDPARMLREVEAKRHILAEYEASVRAVGPGLSGALGRVVDALAAMYSDHPDYDPAWA